MVVPGRYTVTLAKRIDGIMTEIAQPQTFEARPLDNAALAAADPQAVLAFRREVGKLQHAVMVADQVADETVRQLRYIKQTIQNTPNLDQELLQQVRELEVRVMDIQIALAGDRTISSRAELDPPSILDRVQRAVRSQFSSTADITTTHRRSYEIARDGFGPVLEQLKSLFEADLASLHEELEAAGAPWTPGRKLPSWPES